MELTYAELGLIYVELDPRLGGIFISFLLSLGMNSEWKTRNNFQTPSHLLFLAAAYFALEAASEALSFVCGASSYL